MMKAYWEASVTYCVGVGVDESLNTYWVSTKVFEAESTGLRSRGRLVDTR